MTINELIELLRKYDGNSEVGLKIMANDSNDYKVVDINELNYFLDSNSLLIG